MAPESSAEIVEAYTRYLVTRRGAVPKTVAKHRLWVSRWLGYCAQRRRSPWSADEDLAEQFWQGVLATERWGDSYRATGLSCLRTFYRWAVHRGFAQRDPFAEIRRPRLSARFRPALSEREMLALIEQWTKAPGDPRDIRALAFYLVMYSGGLRIGAVIGLDIGDVDFETGTVWVRRDKGGKSHVKPLAPLALDALRLYLRHVRPLWAKSSDGPLFVSIHGRRILYETAWRDLRRAAELVTNKPVTPHTIRRTAATHMRQHGALLEQVQQFLGHAKLETTRLYLAHDPGELTTVWQRTHPLAGPPAPSNLTELRQLLADLAAHVGLRVEPA